MKYVFGVIKRFNYTKSENHTKQGRKHYFVMNLMWRVANSKEFGFPPLRQFTTKLRLFSD